VFFEKLTPVLMLKLRPFFLNLWLYKTLTPPLGEVELVSASSLPFINVFLRVLLKASVLLSFDELYENLGFIFR
jgi:hypothetical protein